MKKLKKIFIVFVILSMVVCSVFGFQKKVELSDMTQTDIDKIVSLSDDTISPKTEFYLILNLTNIKYKKFKVDITNTSNLKIDELTEKVTEDQINSAFINASSEVLKVTTDPIVSSDVIGTTYGSVVDLALTKVLEVEGKQMIKVVAWYDNEFGYSNQMVRTAKAFLER